MAFISWRFGDLPISTSTAAPMSWYIPLNFIYQLKNQTWNVRTCGPAPNGRYLRIERSPKQTLTRATLYQHKTTTVFWGNFLLPIIPLRNCLKTMELGYSKWCSWYFIIIIISSRTFFADYPRHLDRTTMTEHRSSSSDLITSVTRGCIFRLWE